MKKLVYSVLLSVVLTLCFPTTSLAETKTILYCPDEYIQICDEMQDKYGVSSCLLIALIQCESACKPNVVSKAGCCGLMQINPENCEGGADIFDPYYNIERGTQILLEFSEMCEGDLYTTIMLYNGYGNTALRWYNNGQFDKMRYASKVLNMARDIELERYGY